LVALATAALPSERDGIAASMLLSEIARATVVSEATLPSNVVVIGRKVEVRGNVKGTNKCLRIVFPGEERGSEDAISILTPIGAALFGLSEGASIEWCTAARDRMSLTVVRLY
jgi:regulator of nucleoside diphosphate kinase